MRRIAWCLLLIFAFAIPWEYSMDLGEPLGNVARIAGVLLVLVGIPAVFLGLHVFVSVIQAFVFTLLVMIYLSLAVSHEH